MKFDQKLRDDLSKSVATALAEDVGSGDLSAGLIPAERDAEALVLSRQDCILCGQPWFDEVYRQLGDDITCKWFFDDGAAIAKNDVVCETTGPARTLLTGERSALNFLQLLSACASVTREFVDAVAGTGAVILDTRKTLPGLRRAQKYAVKCGGGQNHRMGLYDAILIKENHIAAADDIRTVVAEAGRQTANVFIEVEVETIEQMQLAVSAGADRLLLDNFSMDQLVEAVTVRNEHAADVMLEASGGITRENVRDVAETGVDFISIGALTKDVSAIDFSMRVR